MQQSSAYVFVPKAWLGSSVYNFYVSVTSLVPSIYGESLPCDNFRPFCLSHWHDPAHGKLNEINDIYGVFIMFFI